MFVFQVRPDEAAPAEAVGVDPDEVILIDEVVVARLGLESDGVAPSAVRYRGVVCHRRDVNNPGSASPRSKIGWLSVTTTVTLDLNAVVAAVCVAGSVPGGSIVVEPWAASCSPWQPSSCSAG